MALDAAPARSPPCATVETLLSLAAESGFRPLDAAREGLVGGGLATLFNHDGDDLSLRILSLRIDPGGGGRTSQVRFHALASLLHRNPYLRPRLTKLWVRSAEATGAIFGRVLEEWSIDLVWHLLPAEFLEPPDPGRLPFPFGWSNYFDAERFGRLGALPEFLPVVVRRRAGGGAVIDLVGGRGTPGEADYLGIHVRLAKRADEDGA